MSNSLYALYANSQNFFKSHHKTTQSQKEIKKETMQNLFKRRKRWANVSGLSLKMKTWTQKPHIMVA